MSVYDSYFGTLVINLYCLKRDVHTFFKEKCLKEREREIYIKENSELENLTIGLDIAFMYVQTEYTNKLISRKLKE